MRISLTLDDLPPLRSGWNRIAICPMCNGKNDFSVLMPEGFYRCFKCGASGKLGNSAMLREIDTAKMEREAKEQERKKRRMNGRVRMLNLSSEQSSAGVAYLQSRGISFRVAEKAGVKFCPDYLSKRAAVVFLTRNDSGAVTGKQGRYIDREEPKTKTIGPGGLFATADAWTSREVCICEAPLDALSLAVLGTPSISVQGTNLPLWLPALLTGRAVLLASDSDEPGEKAAVNWRRLIEPHAAKITRLRPPQHDWNDVLKKDLR